MNYKIIDYKLKNCAAVRILSSPNFESSKIMVKFNAGYISEPREKNQIAHILEHIIYDFPPESREWFAEIGAIKNAQTWEECTRYFVETLPEFFDEAVDLLLNQIANPKITRENFEKERENVRSELSTRRQTPIARLFDEKLERIFPNAIPDPVALASLDNISLSDIRAHYDKFYSTDNSRIFIFGNFSEKQIENLILKFEKIKLPRGKEFGFPPIEISQKRGFMARENDEKVSFVFLIPHKNSKKDVRERIKFHILRKILTDVNSGKMYRELRDNGLLYHIGWYFYANQNSTHYSVFSFSGQKKNYDSALKNIEKWIDWAKNGEFSDEDLAKAKKSVKNQFRMSFRELSTRANHLQDSFLNGDEYDFRDFLPAIDEISRQDLIEFAGECFADFKEEK